nr:unnamed protein product [Spirometra erinaceieuropaei]
MSRPRVHSGDPLPHREVGEGVHQDKTLFCAGEWEEQAVVLGAFKTMGIQHSSPGSMVCADADVEVTDDNQPIRLPHRRQEGVHILVEFVPRPVEAGHRGGSVDTDDGGEFASLKRRAEIHQVIIDTLRQTGQSPHDVIRMAKVMSASPRSALERPLQKKV